MEGGERSVILAQHNLSIIPPAEHNFSSLIRQTLILSKKKMAEGRKGRRASKKNPVLVSVVRCRMISIALSSLPG